jgi:hypothetical protein
MNILFLRHKTIKDHISHAYDEIDLFGKHILSLGIPYNFSYKDFEDKLEWQSYNAGKIKALSVEFMKRVCGREFNPGDYSVVFFLFEPTEQGSAGVFTSYGTFECNGAIVSCMPITLKDAQRQDKILWRIFYHEFVHCLFGILNVNYKMNIQDIQDGSYHKYRELIQQQYNRQPTEDELTKLSDGIFNIHLKPHLNKLLADPPQKALATAMITLIGLMKSLVDLLRQKLEGKSVVERLAEAIAEFEGFYVKGTLAERNNNPGNLIWSPFMAGQRDGFAYFNSKADGWKALKYQITLIFDGNSQYYQPMMSIQKFVDVWASTSSQEERDNYSEFIAERFGVGVWNKLNELE